MAFSRSATAICVVIATRRNTLSTINLCAYSIEQMTGLLKSFRRFLLKRSSQALMDQCFVSGTSLLTTVLVGRYCGADGLGLFSLAISVVVMVRGIQETLVSYPYTVFRSRIGDRMTPAEHAGGAVVGSLLLGLIVTILMLIAAAVSTVVPRLQPISPLIWILVITAPLSLAREFARRFEMAGLNMFAALRIDAAVCVLQLGALILLAWQGRLNSQIAVLVVGLVCATVTVIWCIRRRDAFRFRIATIASTIRHDWGFGRWLITDQFLSFAQVYAMHWLLAFMVGTAATGAFAACASIAALASPLMQGIGNYLAPKFAETVYRGSRHDTMRLYWLTTVTLAIGLSVLAILATIFAEQLLWLLYQDASYVGYGAVVGVLSIRMLCGIPALAAHHGIVAMEHPRRSALATLFGLITTVCFAIPLINMYGVVGAAIAVSIGTSCECVALVLFFTHSIRSWRWIDVNTESVLVQPSMLEES